MNEWWLLLAVGLPLLALWIRSVLEVIRRDDLTALKRTVWVAVLVFLPVIGLGGYIVTRTPPEVARGDGEADSAQAEQIVLLAEARQRGDLDDQEYRIRIREFVSLAPPSEQNPA